MARRIQVEREEILWKDRRRRLGMPLSFTRYWLTPTRLFLSLGFFNLHEDEVLLYRVTDISMKISFWDRLFGVGTIQLITRDDSLPLFVIKKVKQPKEVRALLSQEIERARRERGVYPREMMGHGIAENDEYAHDHGMDF